ncbi:hypothetical protein GTO89_01990 [Heliobacterium gestii]|uniref:Uncharacterized protein n=1 Tax=Heliomicrobium gestii TaxID=2699 RepID=A0A845L887_HELGE|nr:hypothetical protein [Heliomicrobium gestii]MBM7865550.1 hypothetical protein [Heliomicrobium gestii]MZP41801.1 hypothetical protein [Heliomicrobium gestii]
MSGMGARAGKSPLRPVEAGDKVCFPVDDSSAVRLSADFLLRGGAPRDPQPMTARLAHQFVRINQGLLRNFGITADVGYDGREVELRLQTGSRVGAIPLLSPTSGKPDYGLVVQPRFDWPGIGPMLARMGWRVIPEPLRLPMLPRSDRKVPPWVLSTMVLFRIRAMLERLQRRFTIGEAELTAPRGSVDWGCYARTKVPTGRWLEVPCRFPDLRDDAALLGALHFTLRRQLASLESQRTTGTVVLPLITLCQGLLDRVRHVPPRRPTDRDRLLWLRAPLQTEVFRDGLRAMEWTIDERGLAGLAEHTGLPWVMSMDAFFEAWCEYMVTELARHFGGRVRAGRLQETVTPLIWEPPFTGSQRFLMPDLVLERDDETIIIDAKYKSHWEELSQERWYDLETTVRERHRNDLLQVLAYTTSYATKRVTACLLYPCRKATWDSLRQRGRLVHQAGLHAGVREVRLLLAAVPFDAEVDGVVGDIGGAVVKH